MKVIFDTTKLHDEVVKAIDNAERKIDLLRAECEAYRTLNNKFIADGLAGVCCRDIFLIYEHLEIITRIRDVTAMPNMRDITLSDEEIDIIRRYTRSDIKC